MHLTVDRCTRLTACAITIKEVVLLDANNVAVWFLGFSLIILLIGFFIYLLAEKGVFTNILAESGDKKIGIQTGRMDSNQNDIDM